MKVLFSFILLILIHTSCRAGEPTIDREIWGLKGKVKFIEEKYGIFQPQARDTLILGKKIEYYNERGYSTLKVSYSNGYRSDSSVTWCRPDGRREKQVTYDPANILRAQSLYVYNEQGLLSRSIMERFDLHQRIVTIYNANTDIVKTEFYDSSDGRHAVDSIEHVYRPWGKTEIQKRDSMTYTWTYDSAGREVENAVLYKDSSHSYVTKKEYNKDGWATRAITFNHDTIVSIKGYVYNEFGYYIREYNIANNDTTWSIPCTITYFDDGSHKARRIQYFRKKGSDEVIVQDVELDKTGNIIYEKDYSRFDGRDSQVMTRRIEYYP